jgi:hypothetical protein
MDELAMSEAAVAGGAAVAVVKIGTKEEPVGGMYIKKSYKIY